MPCTLNPEIQTQALHLNPKDHTLQIAGQAHQVKRLEKLAGGLPAHAFGNVGRLGFRVQGLGV